MIWSWLDLRTLNIYKQWYEGGVFLYDKFHELEQMSFYVRKFVVIRGKFLFWDQVIDDQMNCLRDVFLCEELKGLRGR